MIASNNEANRQQARPAGERRRLNAPSLGKTNLKRLSEEAQIGLASCDRMKKQKTSVGLDILEAVAEVFDLQAWHLLTPNLNPGNPPVIYLTRAEAELYQRFRNSARDLAALNNI